MARCLIPTALIVRSIQAAAEDLGLRCQAVPTPPSVIGMSLRMTP